ncbi:MAG: adenylosuccinate synthase [Anaerolineae bacterium]|nr:adenylosuccinate synthase [Anaerolineae bacterium]
MPVTIMIGAHWGDEGKGRVTDELAAEADITARFAGGDNAGHTVYVNGELFKFHLLPSGILREQIICVLGNGMVINPVNLLKEMDEMAARGVDVSPGRLLISTRAHIISPAHIALDKAAEKARGAQALGTTLRGIGPAYLDKAARQGVRAGQMTNIEDFADALHASIERANEVLIRQGITPLDSHESTIQYIEAAQRLQPYLVDTSVYLNQRLKEGAKVLAEGAQGAMLDVDHGDYPFVTSSTATAGGAIAGLGIGPMYVERVVGVTKAFSSRVGAGPMPTELDGPIADRLRGTGDNFWDEYGTTTGRQRRCGWLDGVILRYSAQVNGFSELYVTKLDVLSGLDEVKIAVAYEVNGKQQDFPPTTIRELESVQPVYETLPGWKEDISGIHAASDLPAAAHNFIKRIASLCDVPVKTVSVGPARDQVVALQ